MHSRDPSDAFCTYAIALEHAKGGDADAALEWFDRSIAADPQAAYTHYHRARALESLGREPEAIESARQGLRVARASDDQHAASELKSLLASWGEIA